MFCEKLSEAFQNVDGKSILKRRFVKGVARRATCHATRREAWRKRIRNCLTVNRVVIFNIGLFHAFLETMHERSKWKCQQFKMVLRIGFKFDPIEVD